MPTLTTVASGQSAIEEMVYRLVHGRAQVEIRLVTDSIVHGTVVDGWVAEEDQQPNLPGSIVGYLVLDWGSPWTEEIDLDRISKITVTHWD